MQNVHAAHCTLRRLHILKVSIVLLWPMPYAHAYCACRNCHQPQPQSTSTKTKNEANAATQPQLQKAAPAASLPHAPCSVSTGGAGRRSSIEEIKASRNPKPAPSILLPPPPPIRLLCQRGVTRYGLYLYFDAISTYFLLD